MLAYFEPDMLAAYPPLNQTDNNEPMLLLTPSKETYAALAARHPYHASSDAALFDAAFPAAEALLAEGDPDFTRPLVQTLEQLRTQATAGGRFNASAWSAQTALLRLGDSQLPGPQFDVPYQKIVALRPKDDDQGFVWEKMYSTYKDRRYRVCGMDLVEWPGEKKGGKMELKR